MSLMIQGAVFYAVGSANSSPVFFKFKNSCRQVGTDRARFLSAFEPQQEHSCGMSCESTFPTFPPALSTLEVTISRIVPRFDSSIERFNLCFFQTVKKVQVLNIVSDGQFHQCGSQFMRFAVLAGAHPLPFFTE